MTAKAAAPKQPLIQQYLTKHKDQLALALPKHVDADRMARIALTECRKTPALLNANPQSLFGAVIQCSQLGLEPGSALGHAYLIPFHDRNNKRTDVQLIIGYKGLLALARNSGQIASIRARAVYPDDEFNYRFGLREDLHHVPHESGDNAPLTHVYAVAELVGGGLQWDVMPRAAIEAVRAQSKAGNSGPWVTHFQEMAKKTVIRRLFKYLPVSVEIQRAGGLDDMAEAGANQDNAAIIEGQWQPGPLDAESESESEPEPEAETKNDRVKQTIRGDGPAGGTAGAGDTGASQAELTRRIDAAASVAGLDAVLAEAEHAPDADRAALAARAEARREQLGGQA